MDKRESFINNAIKVHGHKYDYSNVNYIGTKIKVRITCKAHGEFLQSPEKHLSRGQGCPQCGLIKRGLSNRQNVNNKRDWNFEQPQDYKLIPLTQGKFAKVDNEDFDRVKDINWSYSRGYAHNNVMGRMHRLIMNAPDNMLVDHEDGNPLNNRRSNLRLATMAQNTYNKKPLVGSTSRFLGVCWDKSKNKWVAQIGFNNTNIYLGRFNVEYEAALAYDKKALELFGEFANLNFKN